MSAEGLRRYLEVMGILGCNVNPYLPSLSDVDCSWSDAVALIDRHEIFVSKVYRRRTVYLSPEVYYLLKACRTSRPMTAQAEGLYRLLEAAPPMEAGELRPLSQLVQGEFSKAMDVLLEQMYVTALENGRYLNETWSTYRYGTAAAWEALAPPPPSVPQDPVERLKIILERSLAPEEVRRLLR